MQQGLKNVIMQIDHFRLVVSIVVTDDRIWPATQAWNSCFGVTNHLLEMIVVNRFLNFCRLFNINKNQLLNACALISKSQICAKMYKTIMTFSPQVYSSAAWWSFWKWYNIYDALLWKRCFYSIRSCSSGTGRKTQYEEMPLKLSFNQQNLHILFVCLTWLNCLFAWMKMEVVWKKTELKKLYFKSTW